MTMLPIRTVIFTILTLIFSAFPALAANPPSPLLTTIFTNYGGKAKIADIRTITAKGQIFDLRKGKEGPYRCYLSKDRKMRTEALVTPSSTGEVRVLNNDKGWKNSSQNMNPVVGDDIKSMQAQYEALWFPATFLANKLSLTYESPDIVRNHPVETYTLKLPDTLPLTVQLDAISMLIHQVEWHGQNDSHLTIEFSDFRFVEGVLFPFKLVTYAAEIKVSEIIIATITINEPLATSTFKP